MKTRLICLFLVAVMLVSCLAGCSQKTDDDIIYDVTEEASESAMTLAMYLMSEAPVSAEQEAKIEAEVNKITKAKFKTQIDLKFYTEAEYYQKLEESFAARAEAEKNGLISAPAEGDETKEDETYVNEYGWTDIKYPTISGYQVDIFYLGGYDNYSKYSQMGMLQNLDTELSSASKKLSEYISSAFLTYMKSANGGVYAIPTNTVIGEYTYLLFNKEVLALTHYGTSDGLAMFDSITDPDLIKYLDEIKTYRTQFVPLYTELSNTELAALGKLYSSDGNKSVKFWGVDENGVLSEDFSVVASDYNSAAKYKEKDNSCMYTSGNFLNTTYMNSLSTIMEYHDNGYFGTSDDFANGKAAVICVKGGAELPAQYADDYEAVVIGKPVLQTMDLYENMFAVSSYTASTSRSMEIITYLNTNDDFKNLLLYGIEGENYEFTESDYQNEDGEYYTVVKRLSDTYMMASEKLGNTLIGACLEGENPALREYIMKQNNAAVASITMGFKLDYNDLQVDMEKLIALRALSDTVAAKLNACKTVAELDAAKTEIASLLGEAENAALMSAVSFGAEPVVSVFAGVQYVYLEWAKSIGIWEDHSEEGE